MNLPEFKIQVTLTPGDKITVTSSAHVNDLLKQLFSDTIAWTEEMILLAFNKANQLYGWYRISSGGTSATIVDPKVVFTILLNAGASAFIVAHNHPSGSLKASDPDIKITEKLKYSGEMLDIKMLDHIIVTPGGGYMSMADQGLM